MNIEDFMHDYEFHRNVIASGYARNRKVSHGANTVAAVALGAQASDYIAALISHSPAQCDTVVLSYALSALITRGYTALLESRYNPSHFPKQLPLETTQTF